MFIRLAFHQMLLFFSIVPALLWVEDPIEVFHPVFLNGSALTFFVLEEPRARRQSKEIP
ncbi:MAG TPA: hypothetical protein VK859_15440 [bacterium]|jgi:hypothetical protein|nr:hypothetical protein [bacterium]